METLLDWLEADLTVVDSETSVTPLLELSPQQESTHTGTRMAITAMKSRMFFDLTQRDSDTDSCSDTVSCGEGHVVRESRRLRLMQHQSRVVRGRGPGQSPHSPSC